MMDAKQDVLSKTESETIDAYWRATNYLSVGQIYLYDNPLLKKPLTKEHVKPRFPTGGNLQ
jgi:xylulose-5-phosphate/fructose-6-phosphate phosphoketolase